MVLFALLIVWTSRWTVFDAKALQQQPAQPPHADRGAAGSSAGGSSPTTASVLARSVPAAGGTLRRARIRPATLFAQAVGYSIAALGRSAGLERSRNDELRGLQTGLSSVFGQLERHRVGDDVDTTLDPKAQQVALAGARRPRRRGRRARPADRRGQGDGRQPQLRRQPSRRHRARTSRRFNRATQAGYPPGSTFKVVTATAAIDSGKYTPDSIVNGDSPKTISGVPLANDVNQSFGDDRPDHGADLLGQHRLGPGRREARQGDDDQVHEALRLLRQAAARLPGRRDGRQPAVLAARAGRYPPAQPERGHRPHRRSARAGCEVTPLQMAMVAAAVANGGKLMTPAPRHQGRRPGRPHGRDRSSPTVLLTR